MRRAPSILRTACLLLALLLVAAAPWRSSSAEELLVFAAASLRNALDEANAAYTKASGNEVTTSYAASSALAKQIEQGAPADVFISADLDWMDYLQERDLIDPATRSNLLGNGIVLITRADSTIQPATIAEGFDLAILLGADGRLAMGQVDSVPAGKYGKAALEELGIWPSVADRIAQAENVRAALLLVSRGEAPLGIVYRTDAVADPGVKVVGTFPADSHPAIIYPVAATAETTKAAAGAYLEFLRSGPAKAAFEKEGFTLVPPPGS